MNGVDGNRKVKGIKRHIIVDKNGFLISVMVTIANVHDGKAAYLLMMVLKEMCSGIKVILANGGYRGMNYIYFTSNKSSIIELCEWIGRNNTIGNLFTDSKKIEFNARMNYNSSYTDIMLFKKTDETVYKTAS